MAGRGDSKVKKYIPGMRLTALFVLFAVLAAGPLFLGQASAQDAGEENVKLNLNGASLKEVIKLMETYTGKRFLFDENLVTGKRVNLFSSKPIPVKSMFEVFEAILEIEGLTLLETGEPGSKIFKIIDIKTALKRAMPTYSKSDLEKLRPGDQIVTLMYQLDHASAEDVAKAMSGLTALPGGVLAIPGTNLVQVTDFASNVKRLAGLLELIDKEGPKVVMETIKLKNVSADTLVQEIQPIIDVENRTIMNKIQQSFQRQVGQMLGRRQQPGLVQFSALQYSPVTVVAIQRLGSVIISCEESRMAGIKELVSKLDVIDPEQKLIKYYKIKYADPQSIAQVLSSIFDVTSVGGQTQPAFTRDRRGRIRRVPGRQQTLKSTQKSAVVIADENLRTLVVVAAKTVHEEMEKVIKELDVIGPADAVMRFYQVHNTDLHSTAQIISALFQLSLSTQVDQLRQLLSRARGQRRGGPAITQEHIILPDENLNSLLVVATVEVHEKIKDALAKIDIVGPGDKTVKYYDLKFADPEEVARLLGSIFDITVSETGAGTLGGRFRGRRGQQSVTSKANKNAIILASKEQAKVIVVADEATHKEIAKIIQDLDILGPNESVVRYYALKNADLEETAKILSQVFGLTQSNDTASRMLQQLRRRRGAQAPTVAQTNVVIVNENLSSLIVVAPLKLQKDIEETIKTLDVVGPGERVVQYYKVENADINELANTLGSIFGLTVGSGTTQTRARGRMRRMPTQVKAEKSSVIIPNEELGRIVVVAPKAVQEEVARVIKTLDMKGPNESVVAYYPIEKADLNETASIISQLFNLTLGSVETGPATARGRGRTGRAAAQQVAQVNTVIADANLNSLVVVAAQKIQEEIRAVVAKLDVVGPGEKVVMYYKIKSAQVAELAKTLSNIFDLQVEESITTTRGRRAAAARTSQVKAEKKPVIIPQPELATIVVVASKPVQEEVARVITNLDMVGPQTNVVEYYRLEYTDIEESANILSQIFGIQVGSTSTAFRNRGRGATQQETRKLTAEKVIIPDDNLNNVIVVAPKEVQEEVKRALAVIDVVGPRDNELRFYEVDNTQVDSAAQILSQLYNIPIGSSTSTSRTSRATRGKTTTKKYGVNPVIIPDSDLGSIVVNAPADIHEEIIKVLDQLRFLGTQERMTIKFYKLKNTDAEDIAGKIGSLFGISVAKVSTMSSAKSSSSKKSSSSMPMPSGSTSRTGSKRISSAMGAPKPLLTQEASGGELQEEEEEGAAQARKEFQYGGEPVVVPDKNLNSIIVIAPEYVHEEIAKIIDKLDQRRPQVMFEVAIIDVSADRELNLGVEWTAVDNPADGPRGAGFTNWGVGERSGGTTGFPSSTRVPTTTSGLFAGITKGTYGNIPLLLKVLATNSDVNIRSTPILLVNDNEEASFSSLISEPTTSTSQGTATTKVSFSGFVDAGTVLQLTPHISEGDYIRLEIMLQADTWLGASTTPGVPPAKSTNYVSTMITVPNNRTVIIGGLTSDSLTRSKTGIPILMDIPIIGQLFRYDIVEKKRSKLYLFVRPIILADEEFEDLNKISRDKWNEAMGLSMHSVEEKLEKEKEDGQKSPENK